MKPLLFIAYYRLSTDRQGRSGLGLEAQQQAVVDYVARQDGELLDTFTEVESGRKNNSPQIAAALVVCRQQRATLVIAKLDRLARNVHFISGLLESGVEFVAVDMPEANKLTIHTLAVVAEHEREMISQLTKAALQAAKARGVRLGSPTPIMVRGRRCRYTVNVLLTTERRLCQVCNSYKPKVSPRSMV